jgi:hypothetical protein
MTAVLLASAFSLVVAGVSPAHTQTQTQTLPQEHLGRARALLDQLPTSGNLVTTEDEDENKKAAEELVKLRTQFAEMSSAHAASRGETGAEGDWKLKFSEIERTLARLIGGGTSLPFATAGAALVVSSAPSNAELVVAGTARDAAAQAQAGTSAQVPVGNSNATAPVPANTPANTAPTAGTVPATPPATGVAPADASRPSQPVPVGTSGVSPVGATSQSSQAGTAGQSIDEIAAAKVSTIGIKDLRPDVRTQLEKLRTEIELLYIAPRQ